MKKKSIAIDGPSGAGKSTIAKRLAAETGFVYMDTGAIYRSVALHVIRSGADVSDREAVIRCLESLELDVRYADGTQREYIGGEDVTGLIRTQEISAATSKVSAIPEVREYLLDIQRNFAGENNVIMDGRDIGTVILPDADVKIFLTASIESRAERRYEELVGKGEQADFKDVLEQMKLRDEKDRSREIAPAVRAEDAEEVDTSGLSPEDGYKKVRDTVLRLLKERD